MSGATLYLLGRHLTNKVTDNLQQTTPDRSPVLNNKEKPQFVKINIANQCRNYRNEDYDTFFSALESYIDQVSIGSDFLFILLSDGSVYTMGINRTCFHMGLTTVPLDSFSTRSVYYLHQLKGKPVKMISSGGFYSIMATRNEELYGIGANDYGQFSVYSASTHKSNANPFKIDYGKKEGDRITHMACCFSFSVIIINGTDMRVAGQDWIADETQTSNLVNSRHVITRTFKTFSSPVNQLKSGAFHVVALLQDGRIFCCGSNSRDQLGSVYNNTTKGMQEVVLDKQIEKPIGINCGSDFSIFLNKDRTMERLGSSRYPKFDVVLFKGLEKFNDVLDVNMCEQLMAISRPDCIHIRGNNNTFTLGDGEDEYYELDLDYSDIFQTEVTPDIVGISARYYHIAFFLKTDKKISKHFVFLKRRIDCSKLSDISIRTMIVGGLTY